MRVNHLARWCVAFTVALAIVWLASTLSAKPTPTDRGPVGGLAFLDVNTIFEQYPPIKDALKAMKDDVASAEADVTKRRAAIKKMAELYDADKSNTEEKAKVEVELSQANAKLQADIQLQRAAFVRREVQIYAKVYEEIVAETAEYARENHLAGVIQNANYKVADSSDANAVAKYIGRPVVWRDDQSDITQTILKRLIDKASQEEATEKPKDAKSADSGK